jgi:hypothetical protein
MKLDWTKTETGTYTSIDEEGNKFFMSANKETCECMTHDGKYGGGWTPRAAFLSANNIVFYKCKCGWNGKNALSIPELSEQQCPECGNAVNYDWDKMR